MSVVGFAARPAARRPWSGLPPRLAAALAGAALLLVAVLGVTLGGAHSGASGVVAALREGGLPRDVVLQWRLPRVVGGLLAGAALGISGAVTQRITRNPLAAPDVLGIGPGAAAGAVVALLLLGTTGAGLTVGAVVGGLAAAVVVFVLTVVAGVEGRALLVAGIAVSSVLASLVLWLLVHVEPGVSQVVATWTLGSLTGLRWPALAWPAVVLVVSAGLLGVLSRRLDQLDLGVDLAAATGANPRGTLLLAGTCAVTSAAAAVSVCGPVAFVALLAPHLARAVTGRPVVRLGAAAASGAVVLGATDLLAQHAVPGLQLPTGVVSGGLGAVALAVVLTRS